VIAYLALSDREIDRTGGSICHVFFTSGRRFREQRGMQGRPINRRKQAISLAMQGNHVPDTYLHACSRAAAGSGTIDWSSSSSIYPRPMHQRWIDPCAMLGPRSMTLFNVAFGTDEHMHAVETGVEGLSPSRPMHAWQPAALHDRSIHSKQGARANGRWRRACTCALPESRAGPHHHTTWQDKFPSTLVT